MIKITFINHSTTLIQINGLCILTDPIWSDWIGIPIFGIKRLKPAGIKIEELPQIDVVLISHNHFDHMDIPTLKIIKEKFHPEFITGLGNKDFLKSKGIRKVMELDWWENLFFDGAVINFVPAQHWSGRMPWDIDTTLWGGFVIDTPEGQVYFAGDTAFNKKHLEILNYKFINIKASLLPISPADKIFEIQHMNPNDAVRAHILLNSKLSIGMHTGTFNYNSDIKYNSTELLKEAIKTNNIKYDEFIMLNSGETKIV